MLFRETEAFMCAIQDRIIPTRNYQKFICKIPEITDECRKCGEVGETIEHIVSGCKILAEGEYLARHNNVAKVIHQELAQRTGFIAETVPNYRYAPSAVLESDRYKLTWDRSVLTSRETIANRPDIILVDKQNKATYLIDVAIPNSHNLTKAYNEKIRKYTNLREEIKRIWRQREVQIVPIILSATGIIPKNLFASLELLTLPRDIYTRLQKEAILGTCHLTRRFMN